MFKFSSLLLLTAILLQSISSLVIVAGYELNKEYISKNLCENKNKPMLHCNGKCHMEKQLKSEEKKEQSPLSSSKEKQETVQFFQNPFSFSFDNFCGAESITDFYSASVSQTVIRSIFHPPAC